MTVDKLKLNEGKTEFLIIGTAAQLKKVNISSIVIGQVNVPVVSYARNLGVWFDNNFNMSHHINKTCQSVVYHLHNIRRFRKFLSYEDRRSVVQETNIVKVRLLQQSSIWCHRCTYVYITTATKYSSTSYLFYP